MSSFYPATSQADYPLAGAGGIFDDMCAVADQKAVVLLQAALMIEQANEAAMRQRVLVHCRKFWAAIGRLAAQRGGPMPGEARTVLLRGAEAALAAFESERNEGRLAEKLILVNLTTAADLLAARRHERLRARICDMLKRRGGSLVQPDQEVIPVRPRPVQGAAAGPGLL